MKRLRWSALLACAWLLSGSAHAQPSAADKETARSLLLDGRAKMDAKDYAGALKAFQGAHALMNVPTTGVALAKAQAALGQLLEARETALGVTRMPAEKNEAQAFTDARGEASDLATKLAPRIPSVTIIVIGPDASIVTARLNGAPLATATLGLPRKLNPGHHVITVSAPGYAPSKTEIDVKELEAIKVNVALEPNVAPVTTAATAAPTALPQPTVVATSVSSAALVVSGPLATATSSAPPPSAPAPVWAWVAGGAGLVALGVGVGFFVDYFGVRDTVAKDCPGNVCDPAKQDATSAQALRAQWNRDIGLTIGLGAAALAGIGIAVVGLTQKPSSSAGPTARAGAPHAPNTRQAPSSAVVRVNATGLVVEGAF